jgi:two-component system, OmpR family, response regulator BaeR
MRKGNILIVEDDETIAKVLKKYFENSDFTVSILNSGNGVVGFIKCNPPDLILLDIMLPDKDGMVICREIRSFSNVPIIMVTARVEDVDRMLGLELGADDYICKPFIPMEVVIRAKAVLRRSIPKKEENTLVLGPVVIDDIGHRVTVGGADVKLTPIEYQLLRIMMSAPDKVFTRKDFISKIRGSNFVCYYRTIDNHIKNLRKKIHEHLTNHEMIYTVFGIGYKICLTEQDSEDHHSAGIP